MTHGEVEVREHEGKVTINGHAAVFDKYSDDLGGFIERVRPTAFTKTIKESDVRALYNHDDNMVLGRSSTGTLRLSIDDSGLYYEIDPPNTTYARDLMAVMERGDVDRSSFAFINIQDDWSMSERDYPTRDLLEVKLIDVSPVTYPAYPDADSGLVTGRTALQEIARRSNVNVEALQKDPALLARIIKGETDERMEEEPGEAHSESKERWARRAEMMRRMEAESSKR
jgi:HK97 family phage prohead protease